MISDKKVPEGFQPFQPGLRWCGQSGHIPYPDVQPLLPASRIKCGVLNQRVGGAAGGRLVFSFESSGHVGPKMESYLFANLLVIPVSVL